MDLPALDWRPPEPERRDRGIGLVGCGAITASHLNAYRAAGFHVVALCNPTREKAEARRDEAFPEATVHADHRALLDNPRVEVVDVATHPDVRTPILEDCLDAGKHVLSQKPFVTDLDEGERLCARAEAAGVRLAVNQNGRWAPHHAWMRAAVRAGLVGEPRELRYVVQWDHSWVAGTKFDETEHLLLFDFGVHWFDAVAQLVGDRPVRGVTATVRPVEGQRTRQPMLGMADIDLGDAHARLLFHGAWAGAPSDVSVVDGPEGRLVSEGPDLNEQLVLLERGAEVHQPELEGRWFDDGFRGTMGELLCAIEEDREPSNGARDNLRTLALAFAAAASSVEGGAPRVPGEVSRI